MPHPVMFDDADPVLRRLREIALAFPDAAEKVSHGIPAFYTTKVFAYYGGSEKLEGGHERYPQSVLFLPNAEEHRALAEDERCYVPAYLGPYGWLGLRLGRRTDWTEVRELLDASYRLTAGKRRVAALDALGS